jgi:ribonuclease P protein component
MRRSLTRRERLGRGHDLDRLFAGGARSSCFGCRLVAIENGLTMNRVAVVNARGYRRAVDRNRDRRVFREAFRLTKGEIGTGRDIAFVLYPGAFTPKQRRAQFDEIVRRSGLASRPRGRNG